ncbi:MAG TPA: DUF4386 family protein, partial [Albitalea sp.]|nr:DUF4386 family protein [Albitalea sp.]
MRRGAVGASGRTAGVGLSPAAASFIAHPRIASAAILGRMKKAEIPARADDASGANACPMKHRKMIVAGGLSFIVGALAFVLVFSYLAATFDYPGILDGSAAEVLPRLEAGGSTMRAVWAIYAFLPLLLIPGAVAACLACPTDRGPMTLALVVASIGALAMCLGLMRWPSIHWALAGTYAQSGAEARTALAAVFVGLNLYLGNYIGEFLGEACLASFFLLTGLSMRHEARFPR